MAEYFYRARNRQGRVTKGTIKAADPDRASALLTEHGLVPIEIVDVKELALWRREVKLGWIRAKDRAIFARELATMIDAGIPILQAVRILSQQVDKPLLADVLRQVSYDVEGGTALSVALDKFPKHFSEFFVSMVRSGEVSGKLANALQALADHEERDSEIVRKVRSAMVYPAFVVVVMIIVMLILALFIMPQLDSLFQQSGVKLPLITRALLGIAGFLRSFWWLILILIGFSGFLLGSYVRTTDGRYAASALLLRLPVVSGLFRKVYIARLSESLETLMKAEVPVVRALLIARDVLSNRVYRNIIEQTAEEVKNGSSISQAWERHPEIPLMVSAMVSVGERSGRLSEAFGHLRRFFRGEVDDILANLTSLLEPLMIVIVGIGVAIVLVAVLLPLYSLVLAIT